MNGTPGFMAAIDERKPEPRPPIMPRRKSDKEERAYVAGICKANGYPPPPEYQEETVAADPIIQQAAELVVAEGKASILMIAAQFQVTKNRAEEIIDQLERDGIVGPKNAKQPRTVVESLEGTPYETTKTDDDHEIIEVK